MTAAKGHPKFRKASRAAQEAARVSIPLTVRLHALPHRMHGCFDAMLESFLRAIGRADLLNPVAFCVKELVLNAEKANIKRLYFSERGLDPHDPAHERRAMRDFRDDMAREAERYTRLLKERGMVIRVTYHRTPRGLRIAVRNTAAISARECRRVRERIRAADCFGSLEDALDAVADSEEAAGLGIFLIVGILKSIGLEASCFSIEAGKQETVATITLPAGHSEPTPQVASANGPSRASSMV